MRTVYNMLQAAATMPLPAMLEQAMADNADTYLAQQKEQMFEGIRSDKRAIMPPYAPATIQYKRKKGQKVNVVTLKDTGEFYEGMYVKPEGQKMYIDSRDSKSNALQEKYGDEIFGIGGSFRVPYISRVETSIIQAIKNHLKL